MNRDLRRRTEGEELWVWRHARGLTQAQTARYFGVGVSRYIAIEADRRPLYDTRPEPRTGRRHAKCRKAFRPLHTPSLPLLLLLARRRQGWALRETARRAGTSHVTLLAEERAGADWLRRFWEGRGFIFI